jgi:putative transposase
MVASPLSPELFGDNTTTQRGNRRNDVFFCDNDKNYYLDLLQEYTLKHKVAVLAAYCLMNNHIHLILQPTTKDVILTEIKIKNKRVASPLSSLS